MEISIDNFFKITKVRFCNYTMFGGWFNKYYEVTLSKSLNSFFDKQYVCVWIKLNDLLMPIYACFTNNIIYINLHKPVLELKDGTTLLITKNTSVISDKEKIWNLLANENNLTLDQINILTKLI